LEVWPAGIIKMDGVGNASVEGEREDDLRLICTEEADYANPIEPSERGGEKISRVIVEFVEWGPTGGKTEVFT
jgi:hypothetical protein